MRAPRGTRRVRRMVFSLPHPSCPLPSARAFAASVLSHVPLLRRLPAQVMVTVGSGGEKLTANKAVTQRVQVVEARDKWPAFEKLLESYKPGGVDAG